MESSNFGASSGIFILGMGDGFATRVTGGAPGVKEQYTGGSEPVVLRCGPQEDCFGKSRLSMMVLELTEKESTVNSTNSA